jgi:peptidyl-prolyl cis-trans isomerase B (cyclophilin B)
VRPALTLLAASAALSLAACGDDAPSTEPTATPVDVEQGVCADVESPDPKDTDTPEPEGSLDPSKRNLVTLRTSCGTIVIELAAKDYPRTANAVATLVRNGYWDGTVFHRVVPGFVIQGGDPTGTGTGGPDWKVVEAPKPTETYPQGTVAMAKSGADAPGTVQSQFFIMTGDGLDPQYAVAGRVVEGMDAALAADALGTGDGPPSKPVVLLEATFTTE